MVINFHGDQVFVDFVKFFIHKALYICSTWFLEYQLVNAVIDPFSLFKFIIFSYVDFRVYVYTQFDIRTLKHYCILQDRIKTKSIPTIILLCS